MDGVDREQQQEADLVEPCPFLPECPEPMSYRSLRELGGRRDREFYTTCLRYAQFLWQRGMPARAILQMNRAWSADLDREDPVLARWEPPYRALDWVIRQNRGAAFLGNPVRHFQHLATRVVGARAEVRSWRAWACFHLAAKRLDAEAFPRDLRQIEREKISIPATGRVLDELGKLGWKGEAEVVAEVLGEGSV